MTTKVINEVKRRLVLRRLRKRMPRARAVVQEMLDDYEATHDGHSVLERPDELSPSDHQDMVDGYFREVGTLHAVIEAYEQSYEYGEFVASQI